MGHICKYYYSSRNTTTNSSIATRMLGLMSPVPFLCENRKFVAENRSQGRLFVLDRLSLLFV